jgi:catechol-2,3-dioxygenase
MQPEEGREASKVEAPRIESISAVSLATHDMARSVLFYQALGFVVCYGGESASFSSLAAGSCYVNLIARPADERWSWWGRVIFYVSDVDAMYRHVVGLNLRPNTAPQDAPWGERYFHLTDPDGHELSFARPLRTTG